MKKIIIIFVLMLIWANIPVLTAHADMGPKPSIEISFTGLEGQSYYVALLSGETSSGPNGPFPTMK